MRTKGPSDNVTMCHHYCNEPLRCPECIRRFYTWAQSHTHGRKGAKGPHFYLHTKGPSHAK